MITTVLLTIAMFAILMFGMAVGVIFSNRELKGSCGGSGAADCFCDKNGLPRACEQNDPSIPSECTDHDHNPNTVRVTERGLVITE